MHTITLSQNQGHHQEFVHHIAERPQPGGSVYVAEMNRFSSYKAGACHCSDYAPLAIRTRAPACIARGAHPAPAFEALLKNGQLNAVQPWKIWRPHRRDFVVFVATPRIYARGTDLKRTQRDSSRGPTSRVDSFPSTIAEEQCDDCEKQDADLAYCNICNVNYCPVCWPRQAPHRKQRLASGKATHEKTELALAKNA